MKRFVGVDVGTGNIVCAEKQEGSNELSVSKVKDAFFKLDPKAMMSGADVGFGEKMLKKSGANYVKVDGILHVLGDDAFKFANLFHKECLRPMSKGVLNPNEPVSALMIKELIRGVVGDCENPEDVLYYCIPAEPIDDDFDIVYHEQVLKSVFKELGYKKIYSMTEGLGVVYSELEDTAYTGIGISCGAGMINVAYSVMGMPIFTFSLSRSGDWIDEQVAKAVNETANHVQGIKEKGIDMLFPKTSIEKAIVIYYESLMDYIVQKFKELYTDASKKKELPSIDAPIDVVIAGGTSMIGNFDRILAEKMKDDFPVKIGNIRVPSQPLYAVANGLCGASVTTDE